MTKPEKTRKWTDEKYKEILEIRPILVGVPLDSGNAMYGHTGCQRSITCITTACQTLPVVRTVRHALVKNLSC